jgi:hypothetical protein
MADLHDLSQNPFCTRRVRTGAVPFLFPPGQDADALVERLRQHSWRGEIVGPHGTGKSALLATLLPALQRAGRCPLLIALHDGQRRLPAGFDRDCPREAPTILVIDGYEQLSRWNRWRVGRWCRRRGWGLLVTAHVHVGLPGLFQTVPTLEMAQRIVDRLLSGQSPPFSATELAECFARRGGNLREILFDLYDLYQQRRPTSGQNVN